MKNRVIVIKIGGSLLFNNGKINSQKITEFCNIIKYNENFDTIVVICGGGALAREYINTVRGFKGTEALCDTFGIDISRINSKLLIAKLKDLAYPQVPKSIEELSIAKLFKKIIIMGGLQPGQSTTSVALEVAEYISATEVLILTDVAGIYDKDPKKFKEANLLKEINSTELQKIILDISGADQAAAGEYRIFDAVSLQILKRSKIKVIIMSGKELSELQKFWNGNKDIIGTVITN